MSEILGVKINSLTTDEALTKAQGFLATKKQSIIFTPNPEMLVDAQGDSYFKKVLNSADLNLSDGFGIRLMSGGKIKRVTGVDFVLALCELAARENKSVYLLGSGSKEVLEKTSKNLQNQFKGLRIAGSHPGPKIDFLLVEDQNRIICESEANDEAIHDIIMTAPDILMVAFGHNKQEKWIYQNLASLPSVRIAIGVGGSLDYISGKIKRAPCFLRKIGLEWLYRLMAEPWRFKRIFKAVIQFPLCVIGDKVSRLKS